MRSPINWALLGLIVERPSYAYDLAQRFERRYGSVLPLSNIGHVYTALGALQGRRLIEEIPGTREGRQPRPRYRATVQGVEEYRTWLVGQISEERRRRHMFVLALAPLVGDPGQALEVIARYEQEWLAHGTHTPIAGAGQEDSPDALAALLGRLIDEEDRLAAGSALEWIEYARQELRALGGRVRRP